MTMFLAVVTLLEGEAGLFFLPLSKVFVFEKEGDG